ncbi:uncharacterized protein [Atheta coriaria]|uniref:uncharacterized protein isoform X2 n=1 Tax=Dalotia coriaria TaxID=877792 RepID=UPI0031F3AE45
MSFKLPPSIRLKDYYGRPWSDIEFIEKDGGTTPEKSPPSSKEYHSTRLLPRADLPLFGVFPKLDTRVLLECDKCGKVLLPCVYNAHCANPDHKTMQPIVQQAVVPSKPSNRARKSATKPSATYTNAPASVSSNHNSNVSLMIPKPIPTPPLVSVALPSAVAAAPSNGRSSKPKKSSKSNKRSRKEEKSDPPIPSAEEHPHPTKVVKQDSQHIVAIAANAPNIPPSLLFDNEPATPNTTVVVNAEVRVQETLVERRCDESTSTIPTVDSPRSTFINNAMDSSTTPNYVISICKQLDESELPALEEPIATDAITVSNDLEENQDNSPVEHMPMSPVAVVNIVPVQYLQQYLQLPTQPIVVTIPCTSPSTHLYSYPKPLTVATRAMRKIGSTYLLQNQRLDHQRAEIRAITRSRCTLNHLPT